MTQMSKGEAAFVQGFFSGLKAKAHLSARKVSARFPHFDAEQIACYLNGHDDGIAKDAYRYGLVRIGQAAAA